MKIIMFIMAKNPFVAQVVGEPLRLLVTGAAGFIGSHTVDLLLQGGHRVVGIDDLSTGHLENLSQARFSPMFNLHVEDMMKPGLIDGLSQEFQPDAIIHLAGLVSVALGQETPQRNFELNVASTQLVAETARTHGVETVVFASSAAVYGEPETLPLNEDLVCRPVSNYGAAKRMSEVLLEGYSVSYGMRCVCNRYFNVFGPRQDPKSPYSGVLSIFTERYAQGRPTTIFGDGEQSRDFISVYDIARGNVLAATRPEVRSGNYNLCTGRSVTLRDVVNLLRKHFPSAPETTHAAERAGDIRHSRGDGSKARSGMGFVARTGFSAGLTDLVDYLRVDDLAAVA